MYSNQCKECIVEGCPDSCHVKQEYNRDFVKVVKGKWITVPGRLGNEVKCDQCNTVFWYWLGNYRFCPSCGSKNMDERGERNV